MKRLRAAAAMILVLVLLCTALPCAVLAAGGGGEPRDHGALYPRPPLPFPASDHGRRRGVGGLCPAGYRAPAGARSASERPDPGRRRLLHWLPHSDLIYLQGAGAAHHGGPGYDATTAGNHEFDHEGLGFARMLTAARNNGDTVPALLMANYKLLPTIPTSWISSGPCLPMA